MSTDQTPTLTECGGEIRKRGGETAIVGCYGTTHLSIADERDGLVLLTAEGWRQYSRRYGARRASLAYLCGVDDNGPWAVRVPGTLSSVWAAVDWITPVEVKTALAAGRRVVRQGDVYAVEVRKDRAAETAPGGSHQWRAETRYLVHRPAKGERKHRPLKVSFPCKFVQQRAYEMGRSGRRGAAD